MSNYQPYVTPAHLTRMYGITEKKKSELDALTIEVIDAQQQVEQYQAIVNSLSAKLANFQGFLAAADNNRTQTLNNRNQLDQLVQYVLDLNANSKVALTDTGLADAKNKELSIQVKNVIDKLIYAADVINKLAALVVRKKALNPLISDDLISTLSQAGTDANNAVALTLTALNSVFAAQATGGETNAASALEYQQSINLYNVLTGNNEINISLATDDPQTGNPQSLRRLLYAAYETAKLEFDEIQQACIITNRQLNTAQMQLNKATINLQSLQSGLAAGTAAALAS